MSLPIRNTQFDVVIVAGPRVDRWPTVGVQSLSMACAEYGLKVGAFGGPHLRTKGVQASSTTGGIAWIEDAQSRIHRIEGRAIVRMVEHPGQPDPFLGWRSQGLVPLRVAEQMLQASVTWHPSVAVLGTGNRALRFASQLLEKQLVGHAICVEPNPERWGNKRYAGWEVERRRFERLGGKLIEARPVRLTEKAGMLWELRVEDLRGIRVIEVSRVVSAGPYGVRDGVREYPAGSLLFDFDQSAPLSEFDDVEGYRRERDHGFWLANRIIRALSTDLAGERRDHLERQHRRTKQRLRGRLVHLSSPNIPKYDGKWLVSSSKPEPLKPGAIPLARVECWEEVACDLCQKACPEQAIQWKRFEEPKPTVIDPLKCVGCGLCVVACPSQAISLVQTSADQSRGCVILPKNQGNSIEVGEQVQAVNRRGERMGLVKRVELPKPVIENLSLMAFEVPVHLVDDARGVSTRLLESEAGDLPLEPSGDGVKRVEILLAGNKRMVREGASVSSALLELGMARPGDVLLCADGSCHLCQVRVDGVKKLGCQTKVRRGMSIQFSDQNEDDRSSTLCHCMGVKIDDLVERLSQEGYASPELVKQMTGLGLGQCHGAWCRDAFVRLLKEKGMDVNLWADWDFPWTDWSLGVKKSDPV